MKILVLADEPEKMLWEHLRRERLEGVELILSCGDLPASYLSFLTCFTSAPILYIHGNHDARYEENPPEGCICVDDMLYEYQGVRILGLGGCMRYKPGPYQYDEKEMRARIRRLKWKLWWRKGFDILLTHAPAYQLGDDTDRCHTGFQAFLALMDKYHPAYMLHGHVHKSYTSNFIRTREYGQTKVINAYGSCYVEFPRKD